MLSQWVWIMVCYAEPVVVNHCELCWASGCETLWVMLRYWFWIIVSNAEPVVVNHCVLCWAGCVGIMVCYPNPVVVNHCVMLNRVCGNQGVLFWVSGWESRCECYVSELWWVVLSQWLWITVCYFEPLVVIHCKFCWASGCESLLVMLSLWLWNIVSYAELCV